MDNLRATEIINEAGIRLIAVESVSYSHRKTDMSYRFYARIEPIVVIVCAPRGAYAIDMTSQPMQLERLKQNVPGLEAMIAASEPVSE